MNSGFRIGKLFGININIDWSWLLIFVLMTWNLAAVFGTAHPDWGLSLRWGMGALATVLLFASVLAHEIAHSLTARAFGIPVRSITLFLFGGVSNIERDPESPISEFLIAVVGPVTSLVLGAVLLILGGTTFGTLNTTLSDPVAIVAQMSPVTTLLLWLGAINIILGLFNLIPGFPLDGGRVLRSIFWAITDNIRSATRLASYVGRLIAWAFILAGIAMIFGVRIPFFGTGFINGLWLVFIGWFLNNASVQSYRRVVIQDVLENVRVERMMYRNPPTVYPNITISRLVDEYIMQQSDQSFPVVDDSGFIGIVTIQDIRAVPRSQWDDRLVHEIMTPVSELETTTPYEEASDAFNKLAGRDVRQLPVLEGGQLVGLLRRQDVMRWLSLQSDFQFA